MSIARKARKSYRVGLKLRRVFPFFRTGYTGWPGVCCSNRAGWREERQFLFDLFSEQIGGPFPGYHREPSLPVRSAGWRSNGFAYNSCYTSPRSWSGVWLQMRSRDMYRHKFPPLWSVRGMYWLSFSSWFFIRVISAWINAGVFFVWMASMIAFSLVDTWFAFT